LLANEEDLDLGCHLDDAAKSTNIVMPADRSIYEERAVSLA
jgi:hypothetical protein